MSGDIQSQQIWSCVALGFCFQLPKIGHIRQDIILGVSFAQYLALPRHITLALTLEMFSSLDISSSLNISSLPNISPSFQASYDLAQRIMRLYTIVSWIFILDPQWALISAQRTDRTPLCINIEEEGHLIPEQVNTTVGPWAERGYQDWKENGANDKSFWHWLHKKWAPDAADSIIKCDLSSMCSVVSCRLIDNRHDLQEQWNAYWTLESIATFHNVAYEIRKANMEAWSSVSNDVGTLVSRFSDGSNIEQHKLKHDRNWKVASHVICGVAMLVSGIGVFSTAFINAAPTLALVKGITAVISKEEIAMYAASAGLFNTGASVALNVGSDFMGPKNYVSKMTDTLKHSQMQNQDQIVDRFDAFVKGLLSGNNSELTYLVRQGRYANSNSVLTPEHNKQLRQRWAAS
jgi:hypothetical protein